MKNRIAIIILLCIVFQLQSQEEAQFSKFVGTVHGIEREDLLQEFSEKMLEYRQIEEVSWDKIDFEQTHVSYGIGDLMLQDEYSYGIHLTSIMTILERSCYEFTLTTDDGSHLWVDGVERIDNSGEHPMQTKKDTMLLDTGTYDIKLWYYQGWPDQCGFIFDTKNIRTRTGCVTEAPKVIPEEFTLSSAVLFGVGSSKLKDNAQQSIDEILSIIATKNIEVINIYGYSDSTGSEDANLLLSTERANSIKKHMISSPLNPKVTINAIGKGEVDPVASNETKEGRALNRRVVIEVQ